MSLYTEWRNLSDNHENQEAEVKFWEAYLQAEASIYNELLNNKQLFKLNHDERKTLKKYYRIIECEYNKIKSPNRKNFFLDNYLFFKLFAIIGREDICDYLPLFRNEKTLKKQEEIFKKLSIAKDNISL